MIGQVKNDEIVDFNGRAWCTICSQLIAYSGLKGVVFNSTKCYMHVSAKEMNDESLKTILKRFNAIEFFPTEDN